MPWAAWCASREPPPPRRVPRLLCATGAVRKAGLKALADGQPRLIRVRPGDVMAGEEGVEHFRSVCPSGGTMEIFIEPVLPRPALLIAGASPVARAVRSGKPHRLCGDDDDHAGRSGWLRICASADRGLRSGASDTRRHKVRGRRDPGQARPRGAESRAWSLRRPTLPSSAAAARPPHWPR